MCVNFFFGDKEEREKEKKRKNLKMKSVQTYFINFTIYFMVKTKWVRRHIMSRYIRTPADRNEIPRRLFINNFKTAVQK